MTTSIVAGDKFFLKMTFLFQRCFDDISFYIWSFSIRYGNKSKDPLLLFVLGVIFLMVVILLAFFALYAVEKNTDKGELEV